MSDWKESKSEQPEGQTTAADKGEEIEQDKAALEEVNRLREQEKQELTDDILKFEEEHKVRQSPTMRSAMQGYSDSVDVPGDPTKGQVEFSSVDDQNEEIAESEKGIASLSEETEDELEKIKNLPEEQRRMAMGDFYNEQNNLLGNQTDEGKNMRRGGGIKRDGKGITITDTDGIEHDINYEE